MESMAAMAVASGISLHFSPLAIAGSSSSSSSRNQPRASARSFSASGSPAFLLQRSHLVRLRSRRDVQHHRGLNVVSAAKSEDVDSIGTAGIGAIAGGLIANPVVGWSLYTLKTTGCGLPPGPGGSIGAIEGVSYLVILGVVGWSIYTKVKTGSGLPQGPFGLLGAVEGFSYLTLLAILAVFGFQALDYGFIPGPLPGKECFG